MASHSASLRRVLVVDDDDALRGVLASMLEQEGFAVEVAKDGADAERALKRSFPDIVLCDVRMPNVDGLSFLATSTARHPALPVVMLTAHGDVPLAVEAIKRGARDMLVKPAERTQLVDVLRKHLPDTHTDSLIGSHPVFLAARSILQSASTSNASVLLTGEHGTGKRSFAQALHDRSGVTGRFVVVEPATLPTALFESLLFGHVKGAFSGASSDHEGFVAAADQGTLYLSEVGELSLEAQAKLLRFLEERAYRRVGDHRERDVHLRIVSGTQRDLAAEVDAKRFREDLYYRLRVIPIELPALRQRRTDIRALARHFLSQNAQGSSASIPEVEEAAWQTLEQHDFPGNLRELRNMMERALTFGVRRLTRENISLLMAVPKEPALSLLDARELGEREAILKALAQCGGNKTSAARLLQMSRRNLYYRMQQLGLVGEDK